MTLAPERRRSIHKRIQEDPVWFVEEILGDETWSKQRELLEALRDYDRVACRSCHGVGKTWTAARAALWWLACHADSCAVITTAPTWAQVVEVLWNQIHQAYNSSKIPVGGRLLETKLELADDRFAIGLSPDPHNATNFQGFHAKHLLFIVDEASGVSESIFEAAEGFQTAKGAKMLMIGNPTEVSGTFFGAFHLRHQDWKTVHISVFDSPNFTGEQVSPDLGAMLPSEKWVDEKRAQWGAGPIFQVRVLGDFPDTADDTIIPMRELDQARQRRDDARHPVGGLAYPRTLAVDVARFGSDETVFVLRDGDRAVIEEVYNGMDLMHTTGKIIQVAKRVGRGFPLRIVVDDSGLGGGVTDALRDYIWEMEQMGKAVAWDVDAFNGGSKPISSDDYLNRRAEAWHLFGRALLTERDDEPCLVELPDDPFLRSDLLAPKYKLNRQSKIQLEAKEDTKKRLGRSPDRGDAIVMAWAPDMASSTVSDSQW